MKIKNLNHVKKLYFVWNEDSIIFSFSTVIGSAINTSFKSENDIVLDEKNGLYTS